jgi:hypothetical protein
MPVALKPALGCEPVGTHACILISMLISFTLYEVGSPLCKEGSSVIETESHLCCTNYRNTVIRAYVRQQSLYYKVSEALCCKPAGCEFHFRGGHWIFQLT